MQETGNRPAQSKQFDSNNLQNVGVWRESGPVEVNNDASIELEIGVT